MASANANGWSRNGTIFLALLFELWENAELS